MLRKYWEKELPKSLQAMENNHQQVSIVNKIALNKKHLAGSANTAGIEMDLSFALPVSVS